MSSVRSIQKCKFDSFYIPMIMKYITKKAKTSSFESMSDNEQAEEHEEPNDDGEGETKAVPKRANSLPIIVLIFMTICIQIRPSESKDLKCSSNQISWKNKTTNQIEACMDCPPCPSSQQYSIPCGTEPYIGTEAKCMDCPSGMYSESLDTNPCVYCAICTNKKVLQNCTSYQKAICSRCIKGYFYNRHTFSCMPFSTQATVQPTVPTTLPRTPPTTPTTTPLTTLPTTPPITPPTTPPTIATVLPSSLPTTDFPTTVPVTSAATSHSTLLLTLGTRDPNAAFSGAPGSASTHSDNEQSLPSGVVVVVVLLSIVVVLLFLAVVIFYSRGRPASCRRSCGVQKYVEETITMIASNCSDQLLKDFLYKNYHDADKLCKVLCKKRHATWDFERVASKWPVQIKEEDLLCIKNQIHVENGSPVKMLCEKLITEIPQITVRFFANSLKDINHKAYEILEPSFINPVEVDVTDETVC